MKHIKILGLGIVIFVIILIMALIGYYCGYFIMSLAKCTGHPIITAILFTIVLLYVLGRLSWSELNEEN